VSRYAFTWPVLVPVIIGAVLVLASGNRGEPRYQIGTPARGAATARCDKFAAPYSGRGRVARGRPRGTVSHPFASLSKLDASLAPGQTGCVESGTYGGVSTIQRLSANGTPHRRITITAAPGAQVTVVGWITIEGAYTTVSGLNIDDSNTFSSGGGSGCPSPASEGLLISGSNDILEGNNIYQSVASLRGNGIGIGFDGLPDNAIVRYNRIHDVGGCLAYDHLIYLSHGNDVQIYDNWLWNDQHGWGIQVYPGPTNARIFDNVIDHAGSGLVIADDLNGTTNDNLAYRNVVINSTGIDNGSNTYPGVLIDSPGLTGTGNAVFDNDSYHNPGGISNIESSVLLGNLSVIDNIRVAPRFVNAASHDYRLRADSPLFNWGLWSGPQ
jgi:hypothetical protein